MSSKLTWWKRLPEEQKGLDRNQHWTPSSYITTHAGKWQQTIKTTESAVDLFPRQVCLLNNSLGTICLEFESLGDVTNPI